MSILVRDAADACVCVFVCLKVYEEQRKESRGQIEDLKKEVEQLKQELQTE